MKTKTTYLLLSLLIFAAACQTLYRAGKVLARPALTVLVQQLVQDNSDWAAVIRIVDAVLDQALRSSPPPSTDAVEATIDRILSAHAPGTAEQRQALMAEIHETLQEPLASGYPPTPVDRLHVIRNSIAAALQATE